VLSVGFAGALDSELAVGDIIIASRIISPRGDSWPTSDILAPLPLATERWHTGTIITTSHLLGDPARKAELAHQYEAIAIDMEAATVAEWSAIHAIPFGCVRAISDDATTQLSDRLLALIATNPSSRRRGAVSPFALARALAAEPGLLGQLWRLARNTNLAARNLAEALTHLLDRLEVPI
jgi:adenosylhomocysteine nucleosidase